MGRANFNIYKQKDLAATVRIVNRNKKQTYRHAMTQRDHGQFINLQQIIRSINRKITLVSHYFAYIEKNAC